MNNIIIAGIGGRLGIILFFASIAFVTAVVIGGTYLPEWWRKARNR